MSNVRVLCVDDSALMRSFLRITLSTDPSIEVVGTASNAFTAREMIKDLYPTVLTLDINMPEMNGVTVLRHLARTGARTQAIMLSVYESRVYIDQAFEAGARGYVLKGVSATELIRTINSILVGETYVTPALAARLLKQVRQAPHTAARNDYASLTLREEEILDEVSRGLTNKEIASRLGISEKTVKHYMTNIMEKLQVRNRVEAALRSRENSKENGGATIKRMRR